MKMFARGVARRRLGHYGKSIKVVINRYKLFSDRSGTINL